MKIKMICLVKDENDAANSYLDERKTKVGRELVMDGVSQGSVLRPVIRNEVLEMPGKCELVRYANAQEGSNGQGY